MAINKTAAAVAWCEVHGKLLYASRKEARVVARRHRGEHKSPYRCTDQQDMWHIGDLHGLIISGKKTRDEMKERVA